jgi:hypothetical protein
LYCCVQKVFYFLWRQSTSANISCTVFRGYNLSPYTKLNNDVLFIIWNLKIVSDWRIFLLFHLLFSVSFLFARLFTFKWRLKFEWRNWDVLIFH